MHVVHQSGRLDQPLFHDDLADRFSIVNHVVDHLQQKAILPKQRGIAIRREPECHDCLVRIQPASRCQFVTLGIEEANAFIAIGEEAIGTLCEQCPLAGIPRTGIQTDHEIHDGGASRDQLCQHQALIDFVGDDCGIDPGGGLDIDGSRFLEFLAQYGETGQSGDDCQHCQHHDGNTGNLLVLVGKGISGADNDTAVQNPERSAQQHKAESGRRRHAVIGGNLVDRFQIEDVPQHGSATNREHDHDQGADGFANASIMHWPIQQ